VGWVLAVFFRWAVLVARGEIAMLSKEDNDILTQTDRGTPMGEVFRRYWIPVLLSEEIPLPDCPPVRFRVLGEDLLGFRDSDGRVGVIDPHCPHRGAPLFFGRNEESGIRCLYQAGSSTSTAPVSTCRTCRTATS
jgi:hypothetical protein